MPTYRETWSRAGISEPLTIRRSDGAFETFVARPAIGAQAPAVIVLAGEVRAQLHSQHLAEGLAIDGFMALAPDLSDRLLPVRPLHATAADLCRSGWNVDGALDDLISLAALARQVRGASGSIRVVGWGAGGYLALALAAQGVIDAAVIYAELGLETQLNDPDAIMRPLLLHVRAQDLGRTTRLERRLDDHQWIEVEQDLDAATTMSGVGPGHLADALTRRFLTRRLKLA
jgi:dienelactone hydrolase